MSLITSRIRLRKDINDLEDCIIQYNKIKYFIDYSNLNSHDKVYVKNKLNNIINFIKNLIKNLYLNNSVKCGIDKDMYVINFSRMFNLIKAIIRKYDKHGFSKGKNITKEIITDLDIIIFAINNNDGLHKNNINEIITKTKDIKCLISIYI